MAFEALPVGVLICGPRGDRANAELRRIVRVEGSRPLGGRELERRLGTLDRGPRGQRGPREARPATAAGPIRTALAGDPWAPERMRIERGDGTIGVVRVTARPLALADGPGAVLTVADETAAHEAERLRDAFLGIVGHELRSPISSIFAAAELLRDDHLPADVRAEIAADLGEESHRLHQLVEQLIGLADLRRTGQVASDEPTHLPHLVAARIARWRARQSRLVLDLELPGGPVPPVAAEEGYVVQALDILLDNAVKYSGTSEPLIVRIEASDDAVELHVLDRGPGLPENADSVFGLFWRAVPDRPSGRTGPPGHGIGLFVARSIVEALGGRVWARNRPDGGADVGFSLPIAHD